MTATTNLIRSSIRAGMSQVLAGAHLRRTAHGERNAPETAILFAAGSIIRQSFEAGDAAP